MQDQEMLKFVVAVLKDSCNLHELCDFAQRFRHLAEAQRSEAQATDGGMGMIYADGAASWTRLAELVEEEVAKV